MPRGIAPYPDGLLNAIKAIDNKSINKDDFTYKCRACDYYKKVMVPNSGGICKSCHDTLKRIAPEEKQAEVLNFKIVKNDEEKRIDGNFVRSLINKNK